MSLPLGGSTQLLPSSTAMGDLLRVPAGTIQPSFLPSAAGDGNDPGSDSFLKAKSLPMTLKPKSDEASKPPLKEELLHPFRTGTVHKVDVKADLPKPLVRKSEKLHEEIKAQEESWVTAAEKRMGLQKIPADQKADSDAQKTKEKEIKEEEIKKEKKLEAKKEPREAEQAEEDLKRNEKTESMEEAEAEIQKSLKDSPSKESSDRAKESTAADKQKTEKKKLDEKPSNDKKTQEKAILDKKDSDKTDAHKKASKEDAKETETYEEHLPTPSEIARNPLAHDELNREKAEISHALPVPYSQNSKFEPGSHGKITSWLLGDKKRNPNKDLSEGIV